MRERIAGVLLLLMPLTASAGEFWIGGGGGGDLDGTTLILGGRGEHWGGDFRWVNNGEYTFKEDGGDVRDYRVPHSNYRYSDRGAVVGDSVGGHLLHFFDTDWGDSIYLGAGAFFTTRCDIATSNVTGWRYCHNRDEATDGSAVLGYEFRGEQWTAHVEVSSLVGPSVAVGWRF